METTREPARTVPRQGEPTAPTRERDEADRQIAERLAAEPEPPQPSQEEADQIKEQAQNIDSGVPKTGAGQAAPQPPAGETAEQRRERERQARDQQRTEQTSR